MNSQRGCGGGGGGGADDTDEEDGEATRPYTSIVVSLAALRSSIHANTSALDDANSEPDPDPDPDDGEFVVAVFDIDVAFSAVVADVAAVTAVADVDAVFVAAVPTSVKLTATV